MVLHAFNLSVGEAATAAAISETEAILIYTMKLSFKNKKKGILKQREHILFRYTKDT